MTGPQTADDAVDGEDRRSRQPGVREVLLVAAVVVVLVLAAAGLTAVLPRDAQGVVFHTPLLIAVLIAGTALVLWRILRAPRA
jgi:FtsH-binding integral membrane protein